MTSSNVQPLPDANNRWFVLNVSKSEQDCTTCLRYFGILVNAPLCTGRKGKECNTRMVQTIHRGTERWRCPKSNCRTYQSIACENDFLCAWTSKVINNVSLACTTLLRLYGSGVTPKWLWAKLLSRSVSLSRRYVIGMGNAAWFLVRPKACCLKCAGPPPSPFKLTSRTLLGGGNINAASYVQATGPPKASSLRVKKLKSKSGRWTGEMKKLIATVHRPGRAAMERKSSALESWVCTRTNGSSDSL